MTKIKWSWRRCGNLIIAILGIVAITMFFGMFLLIMLLK